MTDAALAAKIMEDLKQWQVEQHAAVDATSASR
jgi:hypothetical protein